MAMPQNMKKMTNYSDRRFKIAFSFAGEQKEYVQEVADCVNSTLGGKHSQILYYPYHQPELARKEGAPYIRKLYLEQSQLIVVFLSNDYIQNYFSYSEWEAIKTLFNTDEQRRVLLLSFDKPKAIPPLGITKEDVIYPIEEQKPAYIARQIVQRWKREFPDAPTTIDAHRTPDASSSKVAAGSTSHGIASKSGISVKQNHRAGKVGANVIQPAFGAFVDALHQEQARVDQVDQRSTRDTLQKRVPKFLIFRRARRHVLAICDENMEVDPMLLQKTNESQVRARLVDRAEIPGLGFATPFVHPMFYDESCVFERIFVDGVIFFHFLYFPGSAIQIPSWENGAEYKEDVSISAFIRTLLKFHGGEKVIFSNITRAGPVNADRMTPRLSKREAGHQANTERYKPRWPDEKLLAGLKKISCSVRFAPTPSRGLHVGNVRSGLIPYLMYRANLDRNLFFIRFDDTGKTKEREKFVSQIESELSWLGFSARSYSFRQTDTKHQAIYRDVLLLLEHWGYTKDEVDGSVRINYEHPDLQLIYWLDMNRGPMILHGRLPIHTKSKEHAGDEVSFTLADKDGTLLYKLCGAVDDLLFSSHVVRDIRQEGLTAKQSLIRFAIYKAFSNANASDHVLKLRNRIIRFRKDVIAQVASSPMPQPLPFLSPPIYCHVGNVVDESGSILRKRNFDDKKGFSLLIEACKDQHLLPETLITCLLATIVPPPKGRSFEENRKDLGRLAGQFGVAVLLDLIATHFSPEWLIAKRQNVFLRERDLRSQERVLISGMTFFQFVRHIRAFETFVHKRQPSDRILRSIWINRKSVTSWREVLLIAYGHDDKKYLSPSIASSYIHALEVFDRNKGFSPNQFLQEFSKILGDGISPAAACRSIRSSLIGCEAGIPLLVLGRILGVEEVRSRCATK